MKRRWKKVDKQRSRRASIVASSIARMRSVIVQSAADTNKMNAGGIHLNRPTT